MSSKSFWRSSGDLWRSPAANERDPLGFDAPVFFAVCFFVPRKNCRTGVSVLLSCFCFFAMFGLTKTWSTYMIIMFGWKKQGVVSFIGLLWHQKHIWCVLLIRVWSRSASLGRKRLSDICEIVSCRVGRGQLCKRSLTQQLPWAFS